MAKIVLIGGPTASGKSALAIQIARKVNGTIINADAMQVYSGLSILTAQPSAFEAKEIPHALYGVFDPSERSSAGKWQRLAVVAIDKALEDGRTPILVGGTGLYFRALFGGLADIPDIPEAVRGRTKILYDELGEEKFRAELAKSDPDSAARIARNDRQRLMRAHEVVAHTGKSLTEWHKSGADGDMLKTRQLEIERHLLLPPREELYANCDRRFHKMIERGAVDEAHAMIARNVDPELPVMKTLGLREIGLFLKGDIPLTQAIADAQKVTRNYAKRQVTWFRNQW